MGLGRVNDIGCANWRLAGGRKMAAPMGAEPGRSRAQIKQRRAILALAEAQSLLAEDAPAAPVAAVQKAEAAAMLDPQLLRPQLWRRGFGARRPYAPSAQNIETGLAKSPACGAGRAWLECHGDQPAAGRMRAVGRFIGKHSSHEEAAILQARIALATRRFRQAANFLAP